MEIKGIVFDLDATLVNLGGYVNWREAHKRATSAYIGANCDEEMVLRCSERGLFNMLNLIREENSSTMLDSEVESIQMVAYDAVESCEKESIGRCELMPGCLIALNWLKKRGYNIGIATSNSQSVAEKILEDEKIDHFFESVVGRRPELKMKPHPDQIFKCLEEMGVEPSHGVMVGDSVRDALAAKKADIFMIAVPSFFTKREALEEAGVNVIIETLNDLPEAILRAELY